MAATQLPCHKRAGLRADGQIVGGFLYRRTMDVSPLITAASSLLGALIGAGAALGSQRLQWGRERKANAERGRQQAIEEIASQTLTLDFASHRMVLAAKDFSSLTGQLNRVVRVSTAFDLHDLFRELETRGEALNRAAAQIWMTADQETVRLTNAVVATAADLVAAHSAVQPATWRKPRRVLDGFDLADQDKVAEARTKLADARRALLDHTRKELRRPPVDLFALPDGFIDTSKEPAVAG